MSLDWEYFNKTVKLSAPGHFNKLLIKYAHTEPKCNQHTLRQPEPIFCGTQQPTNTFDTIKDVTKDEKLVFQSILGSLLFYGRMIDSTMLITINDLSIVQTKATKTSISHLKTLLDYLHANPNSSAIHRKSDMIINVHSDGT